MVIFNFMIAGPNSLKTVNLAVSSTKNKKTTTKTIKIVHF